eukprot:CAMPEP_0179116390 /NCGR_PEP_ID=MMETSP0796-20121207/54586_1 /TAXON_ID=73915 /ORGANISM="Pyrodinium bahamense, Strain pbaha01" /LENGTH=58 /DNA_ID=CAMNT_0020814661 /DNA_START=171 /DNA_END=343 /DNA_ORIENTATION=-
MAKAAGLPQPDPRETSPRPVEARPCALGRGWGGWRPPVLVACAPAAGSVGCSPLPNDV